MDAIFKLFDDQPAIPAALAVLFVVLWFMRWRSGRTAFNRQARRALRKGGLDTPLLWFSQYDPFTIRHLLTSVLILGMTGSGKTSSSGRAMQKAIVSNPQSGGLILAAKPEDADDVIRIFKKAGRLKDLIVFGPDSPYRFNFLRYVGKGDPRNVVRTMMMIGETLERGERGGGEDGDYWKAQCERLLETAVIALQMAGEEVTPLNLHAFVIMAATKPDDVMQPAWQAKYHAKILEAGHNANKSKACAHDYEIAKDYWLFEFPGMADRTRSSILTYATQILHVFNTGLAREMIAGETNITPDAILSGKWVLVNFPPSSFGAVGSLICAGWKYLTQLAILKRKADENSPFVTLWADESHLFVNSFDSTYIATCRSHKGCLVFLSQSVSSFYGAMRGEAGHHQADALLANFSHTIIHACDPTTAKWAASKLGREQKTFFGGSSSQGSDLSIYDRMYGDNHVSSSFSTHMETVLDDSAFMVARTGGPENGYVADAVVLKSGEPFANGANWLRVAFSQK
jgi:type IV secretory pathway TraG/TraD family ATPase VirD4